MKKTNIVTIPEIIQELVTHNYLDPYKNLPFMIKNGYLSQQDVETWQKVYDNKFFKSPTDEEISLTTGYPEFSYESNSEVVLVTEPQVIQEHKTDVNLHLTKDQLLDVSRTLNLAYSMGYAEYTLDNGQKISIKIVE